MTPEEFAEKTKLLTDKFVRNMTAIFQKYTAEQGKTAAEALDAGVSPLTIFTTLVAEKARGTTVLKEVTPTLSPGPELDAALKRALDRYRPAGPLPPEVKAMEEAVIAILETDMEAYGKAPQAEDPGKPNPNSPWNPWKQ